ncbi:hypothetical protein KP509_15G049100 [Ceratopteris richardii]|uniref:Haloacid dehalogenase-like hydrolase domain-containing protein 3 n=1 Tax=Ceratopteris richardii TaxID=49495 RepID=A0A8T2T6U2_CERRI|nr:hypothetical protein KP509_15G049100 [Ceratopteris richardii]KAH7404899.1 hypothetical protein KP509_15G049100 [Ceratopteris richardii]KAH7404900.1 hypothetical protein KP509_15G049100 [Ceratopteris richardii]
MKMSALTRAAKLMRRKSAVAVRSIPPHSVIRRSSSTFGKPSINGNIVNSSSPVQLGLFQDYERYRRSLYGGLAYKALLVDAAGTLIIPSEPAAKVYHDVGMKYGVRCSESEILRRYRWAYAQPWSRSRLRYENDARPFWQFIVEKATGCNDPAYLEELYHYYTTAEAWRIADPDAGKTFEALRQAGVKVGVVSNFDTRLRPLLNALNCGHWFDAMAISAEVGAEKPNPAIFSAACELLGVHEQDAVHVGDDRRNDIWGARDAGCDALLWGEDVTSFRQVAEKIGVQIPLP